MKKIDKNGIEKEKMEWAFFFWVAVGGAAGSVARELIFPLFPVPDSWVAVLLINGVGSFVIGLVYSIEHMYHPHFKNFAAVGFCGGFSTFSHFTYQTIKMVESGHYTAAFSNIGFSIVLTMFAVWAGLKIPAKLLKNPGTGEKQC